jgi:prolyl oligopeptidase
MPAIDIRPTTEAPDDDPYLWLEEIEGAQALAWVKDRTAATINLFGGAAVNADRDALAAIFNRSDNIPHIARRGRFVYNLWQDATNPRGLWRRTTLQSYAAADPEWELLVDLDALATTEDEDWTWAGAAVEPEPRQRAIIALSRGGADAVVQREFDLDARRFVPDGFMLPEAKQGLSWVDRDTVLMSSPLGEGMATRSGYARAVRLWRRGQAPLDAPVIFETGLDSMAAGAVVDRTAGVLRVWFAERPSFFETVVSIGDQTGPKQRIDLPRDAHFFVHGDWLAVNPKKPWTVSGRTYRDDSLLGIRLSSFLTGSRDFAVLFEPAGRRALRNFHWNGERLAVSTFNNLVPEFEVLTPADGHWTSRKIEGLSTTGVINLWPLDLDPAEMNGESLLQTQDPLTPAQLSLLDLKATDAPSRPKVLKSNPPAFDAAGRVVRRHEAVSSDGEKIPYIQIGPAGETGDTPVHMTGYGGFSISAEPYYNSAVGKLWLERGGASVIANIRGGGEFGAPWHEAGRRAGKRLSHDDFAAVAADLVRRGVTRPQRIAAEGGSNGGLLIANMLTRYPQRFGALFCTIPLTDMRRYTKLLAGPSWIDEYGDPDKPGDWAFLKDLSAYHVAAPGKIYPPILLATTRRDDRVHPGHARKFAAKLQALGYRAFLYEPEAGGHGYGKDNTARASFIALGYKFLREAIGWAETPTTATGQR